MSVVASRQHLREKQVEQIVRRHPEALDSYRALLIWFWVEVDGAAKYDPKTATFSIKTWNLYRLTSPEAVSRAFRRLVESKVVIINEETERRRKLNEVEMKRYHLEQKGVPRQ
jgi:hypothetical protein